MLKRSSIFIPLIFLLFISCQHENKTIEIEDLFPIVQNGKFGYINRTGKIVINPQFDEADHFSEGLACVKINDKFGYIDKSGEFVINPQFGGIAYGFSEGLACVPIDDDLGYIDKTGKVIISPQFNYWAYQFSEGLAYVETYIKTPNGKIDSKFGYINKTGKIVIQLPESILDEREKNICTSFRGPDIRERGFWNFSEGMSCIKINNKFGYIDKSGKVVINPQFDIAYSFSEGLACVAINDNLGYIDKKGNIIIPLQFKPVWKWYYWYIFDSQKFTGGWNFSEGLAAVSSNNQDWGYINKTGGMVIEPSFYRAAKFSGGIAKVMILSGDDDKIGYIDKTGKYVWEPTK